MVFRRILVATDGSENAKQAVRVAARLAAATQAERLAIIHVVDVQAFYAADTATLLPGLQEQMEDEGRRILDEARELARSGHWHGEVETHLAVGDVTREIRRYASEGNFDLLLVGRRGLGTFERLLLGSVSTKLVQQAPCSVLVIRKPEGRPDA